MIIRDGVEICNPLHLLITGCVHSIYSKEMEWPVFTHNIWSLQHLHISDGIHSIYS